jgi:UDP:flavonoid glycosyltransferase YjiC (YdhE family)
MRVLCSTPPTEGALGPAVPLAKALAEGGHEVIVATGPDLQQRISEQGLAGVVAGPTAMEGALAAMADPAVKDAGGDSHLEFPAAMFGGVIAPAKLPALRELADDLEPTLVLHPPIDLAAPLLAAERGLPSVCYGFGHPLEAPMLEAMARRVAPLWSAAGLDPDPHAGLYLHRYLDPCPPRLRIERGPAEAVAEPIRPEIPGDPDAPLPAWAERLGDRPTVYVSLGTVPLFNQPTRFQVLLERLVAEDLELVVTVSELHDPADLGELPPNVHVERWLPLAPLLTRCDAVLCHAGTGTTLAALAAGQPLVAVPDGADQFTNAAACQAAGVARVLAPEEVTAEAVRDAVALVLEEGSGERAAASLLAAEIAAMPSAAQVAAGLPSWA